MVACLAKKLIRSYEKGRFCRVFQLKVQQPSESWRKFNIFRRIWNLCKFFSEIFGKFLVLMVKVYFSISDIRIFCQDRFKPKISHSEFFLHAKPFDVSTRLIKIKDCWKTFSISFKIIFFLLPIIESFSSFLVSQKCVFRWILYDQKYYRKKYSFFFWLEF